MLEGLVASIDFVELGGTVAELAGEAAERYALRAGDAVHLASAVSLGDRDLVVASWDDDLRRAALKAGLDVAP